MKKFTIIIGIVTALSGCTIAPKGAPPPKTISEWVKHNLLSHDSTGYTVGGDWVRAYHDLIKNYGNKLPITERVQQGDMNGITAVGDKFHITFEVNKRFIDLQAIEADSGP